MTESALGAVRAHPEIARLAAALFEHPGQPIAPEGPARLAAVLLALRLGERGEPELLARCHRRSVELAAGLGARTIVFPAISTGAYGYPLDAAARVAVGATAAALDDAPDVERVTFCLFGAPAYAAWADALPAAGGTP